MLALVLGAKHGQLCMSSPLSPEIARGLHASVPRYLGAKFLPRSFCQCMNLKLHAPKIVNGLSWERGRKATHNELSFWLKVMGESPAELQQLTLPVWSNEECEERGVNLAVNITENMVCAGWMEGDKSSCHVSFCKKLPTVNDKERRVNNMLPRL